MPTNEKTPNENEVQNNQAQLNNILAYNFLESIPIEHLKSGDVLVQHVWTPSDGGWRERKWKETLIRVHNGAHWLDKAGAKSAEHCALVAECNGRKWLVESITGGVNVRELNHAPQPKKREYYSVFRCDGEKEPYKNAFQLLCNSLALRIIKLRKKEPITFRIALPPFLNPRFIDIAKAAVLAHEDPQVTQSSRYGGGDAVYSVLPNIIPDSVFSNHHKRLVNFIRGREKTLNYMCSGLVAICLQAWSIPAGYGRIFIDPSQASPATVEHHLHRTIKNFKRIGRYQD